MQRQALIMSFLLTTCLASHATTLRLDRSVIVDAQGFGQPMAAGSLFIPHGWQTGGGIEWGQQHTCVNGYAANWTAQAADGSAGMAILPQQQWEWNHLGAPNIPGCPLAQIDSAQSYLSALAGQIVPNGQITGFRRRADLEQQASASTGVQDDGFQRMEVTATSGEIFLTFTDAQGRAMRGSIIATVVVTYIRTGGGGYGTAIESWTGFAHPAFASWGLAHSHDPSVFEALRRSYTPNPPWQQLIAQHNAKMGQIAREGIRQRGEIWRNTHEQISRIINDTWRNQQQSADYRAREFLEYIRGVETYNDAGAPGGTVQLSSFYDQAWKLADGTYVLTSDPSFDPYGTFGVSGERLVAAGR